MGTTNRAWHERHRMPEKATLAQRIAWHLAHADHCGCRPIPAGVARAIEERGSEARARRAPARRAAGRRPS